MLKSQLLKTKKVKPIKQQSNELNIELPLDRVVCLKAYARDEWKGIEYGYCLTDYFLLDNPLNVEEHLLKRSSGDPIPLGLAVQLTGENKGMVYNVELRDWRAICTGIKVYVGNYESQLLYCQLTDSKNRETITLGEIIDLAEKETNDSKESAKKAAYENYKEWGHKSYN